MKQQIRKGCVPRFEKTAETQPFFITIHGSGLTSGLTVNRNLFIYCTIPALLFLRI